MGILLHISDIGLALPQKVSHLHPTQTSTLLQRSVVRDFCTPVWYGSVSLKVQDCVTVLVSR